MQAVALTSKGWAAVPKGLCKDSPGLPRLCVSTHKLSAKLAEVMRETDVEGSSLAWALHAHRSCNICVYIYDDDNDDEVGENTDDRGAGSIWLENQLGFLASN